MSTKANPGKFNCWAAAMPDEPVFTILGRDPAFPATVAFWKTERQRLGKTESDDDLSRLLAIPREIQSAVDWREANVNGPDGEPTWHTKMSFVTDDTQPIRVPASCAPRYLNQDEVLGDMREIVEKFTEGTLFNDYDRACELLGVLKDVVRDMETPIESNTFNEDRPQQIVYTEGLIRTVHGDLTIEEVNKRLSGKDSTIPYPTSAEALRDAFLRFYNEVGRDLCQNLIKGIGHDTLGGLIKHTPGWNKSWKAINAALSLVEYGVFDSPSSISVYGEHRDFGDEDPSLTPGEKVIVDSAPEDLAHKPEVPQHRFSMFSKGESYAYARGLEIAPTHLPTALDAMLKDGWKLVSLFGATDAENVGFIFERAIPPQVVVEFEQDEAAQGLIKRYMTDRPKWAFPNSRVTISNEVDQYRKGHPDLHFDNSQILASLDKVKGTAERMSAQIKAARAGPKIEVHVEGMAPVDAIQLMSVIECRMQWLPQDYESVRIVGLIAEDPEAAFDFTQKRGQIEKRKTLIKGDCGATEFGRQLEG